MNMLILKLAADSPEELRRCDVFRVVDSSNNAGCLEEFCKWLVHLRPDLADEVAECFNEISPMFAKESL